ITRSAAAAWSVFGTAENSCVLELPGDGAWAACKIFADKPTRAAAIAYLGQEPDGESRRGNAGTDEELDAALAESFSRGLLCFERTLAVQDGDRWSTVWQKERLIRNSTSG